MKKILNTILATSAIATGLVFAGGVKANADTTVQAQNGQPTYSNQQSYNYNYGYQDASTTYTNASATTVDATLKQHVLSEMAAQTGVPEATWDAIITRESNWEPNVVNSTSGAYGLFQNMHISSGSVEDQVSAAISLFKVQGLGAWSL